MKGDIEVCQVCQCVCALCVRAVCVYACVSLCVYMYIHTYALAYTHTHTHTHTHTARDGAISSAREEKQSAGGAGCGLLTPAPWLEERLGKAPSVFCPAWVIVESGQLCSKVNRWLHVS